ncbi:C1 protein [Malvastrum leaf curl Guangdong betasatellite]|uniref:C1 protein n=1 Tax=Malvastrum leaf curl Guangdong betasatellite TaxID=1461792 RepID=X2J0V8_9VIRU|nr:C1 protein [Malvastrum leaf curl Guangdong betasatellite]AHN49651.1 C1 protein [Malvastrum leaf curl Guangdong betasatellite]
MTIRYKNTKGVSFVINVRLRKENSISVEIDLFSQKTPYLHKQQFVIPYSHQGIITPFNFNDLEEGIKGLMNVMYAESPADEFRHEDMIEAIDILMMQEAHVIDINLGDKFNMNSCTSI